VFPQDGRSIDGLLGAADNALYRQKSSSKGESRLRQR
jgi:predicted signal transduction protein with EAL and GGDEF domain